MTSFVISSKNELKSILDLAFEMNLGCFYRVNRVDQDNDDFQVSMNLYKKKGFEPISSLLNKLEKGII